MSEDKSCILRTQASRCKDIFSPFETIELNVAGGLEQFLTDRFGDYMKVPSIERIRYEQHASKWALGEYKYDDKSDEKYLF